MQTINDIAVRSRNIGLLDALDRVLDKGVVVDGDVQLCVAGIELVYLKLKLLLASTATVERFGDGGDLSGADCFASALPESVNTFGARNDRLPSCARPSCARRSLAQIDEDVPALERLEARVLREDEPSPILDKPASGKVDIDPKKVEQGLAKLVLTLVELLRKLMEKQALRRVELGTLTDKEIDTLGEAFMRLDERMKQLKKVFDLEDSDLNLDLGPVGDLI